MSQPKARILLLLCSSAALAAATACTSLLGDFEVVDDAGGTGPSPEASTGTETGTPDTSTPDDAGPDTGPPPAFIATAIATGQNHTCAVRPPGHVYCWGDNTAGQLGVPRAFAATSNKPLKVPNLGAGAAVGARAIVKVYAGDAHTCALDDNGHLWCWGSNSLGQLGNGEPIDPNPHPDPKRVRSIASQALPLDGVVQASLGPQHSCAALSNGDAVCWGRNADGEGGVTPTPTGQTPTKVPAPVANVSMVSAGPKRTCALSGASRIVWCWGRNQEGELGADAGTNSLVLPSQINLSTSPTFVSAGGERHTCVNAGGVDGGPPRVLCFGGNDLGQLGDNGPSRSLPREVSFPGTNLVFDEAHTRGKTTCARPAPGSSALVACWGGNNKGQLGQGTADQVPHDTPAPIAGNGLPKVSALSVGFDHTCAIQAGPTPTDPGAVFCWGSGAFGKLGVDPKSTSDEATPKRVIPE